MTGGGKRFVAVIIAALAFAAGANCSPASEAAPPSALNVADFGARGDGGTDDTEAFANALKAAAERGVSEVAAPPGLYRIGGALEIPHGISLSGSWKSPHHAQTVGPTTGTVILAVGGRGREDGPPLFLLNANAALRGLTIFYPEQSMREVVPYPWTIQGRGMHCTIENLTLVNAYQAVDFGTHHNELHVVRNVFGLALRRGIWVDNCTDIGRIENVHFNPHYWARSPWIGRGRGPDWNTLMNYLVANGEAFIFGRSDWEYVLNTFCYGYRVGYKFIPGRSGIGTNGNFLGIGADGGNIGLLAEAANPYGLLVTNGEFVAMRGPEPTEIVTGPDFRGVLQLNNCAFWGPAFRVARLQGPGTVSFNQCNFVQWNRTQPALRVEGGAVSVIGCRFQKAFPHIFIGEQVKGATLIGNLATGPFQVERHPDARVEMLANIGDLQDGTPSRSKKEKTQKP